MGLRAASVRHPNAVVMAPALTEAGQSKNFSLPPSPSSPINTVSNNDEDDNQMCKSDLKIKRAYTTTKYTTTTTTTSLPVRKTTKQQQPRTAASDNHHLNYIIMSTCPTSMGDQEDDTMGLQKTGMDAVTSLLKDKNITNDVEQLLNNFGGGAGDTGDLTQNVDDLMQAWNANMESSNVERGQGDAETETETMFPIGSFDRELFSEVDMINMCGDDDNLCSSSQTAASKELRAKEILDELHKKQVKLERRTEFILRRIKKLQIRHMGYHCSSEVAGLYEYVHRTLRRVKETSTSTLVSSEINEATATTNTDSNFDLSSSIVVEAPQPVNALAVNNLVRKLHLSSVQQSNALHRQKHVAKYFGSGSSEQLVPIPIRHPMPGTVVVPKFPADTRDEIERVAGTLQTELISVESQIDSDATASSSGAESCDEMQTYNNQHQNYLSINKRAAWRYANERAQVASRWTWLQAQISDLEYRIRQYNDLHRQIRLSKGAVTLGDASSSSSSSPIIQQHHRNSSSSPMSPSAVNGYRGQLPGATGKITDDLANGAVVPGSPSTNSNSNPGCSRTRPLYRSSFRKRKLLQTTGLHTVSKKASRPSNIRCGCVPPIVPCALCTGRTDPTFPRDCAEQLTVPERIALLDPGFHPVLSFPDDICQSIHLEAIMKLPDWQQKSLRCNLKSLKGMAKSDRTDKTSSSMGGSDRPKKSEHRKKYNNRLSKSGMEKLLFHKLKNKMGRGRRSFRGVSGFRIKKRHTAKMAMAQLNALASESMDELDMEAMSPSAAAAAIAAKGGVDSLTPSPLSHVQVVPYRRNRSVDSYDIDNIVIPYSVAAATRVEKLQYKEILTPKWRVIDCDFPAKYDKKNNGIVRRVSEDSDSEDVTEETITSRHDKCEHEEKKKFLSYIKFPLTGVRSRANRRTDSRAESSGANTPDPMSPPPPSTPQPHQPETSPLTSPPATPISMLNDDSSSTLTLPIPIQSSVSVNVNVNVSVSGSVSANTNTNTLRRRTISQSRWAAHNREESRCITPDIVNVVEAVPPYEPRVFPLPEDLYDKMLKSMPEGHTFPGYNILSKQSSRDSDVTDTINTITLPDGGGGGGGGGGGSSSRAGTPVSDSTESAIAEEDPNDPEWIDVERVRDRAKR